MRPHIRLQKQTETAKDRDPETDIPGSADSATSGSTESEIHKVDEASIGGPNGDRSIERGNGGIRKEGERPKRSLRPVVKITAVLAAAALLAAGATSGFAYYLAKQAVGDIPKVSVNPDTLAPVEAGQPQNFLVLGSDSREGENSDFGSVEEVGGRRSDTMMILQLDPKRLKGVVLSIPRDARVEIPGRGIDKINAAYAYGGADLAIQTVSKLTGLKIHHYIEIDFTGFISVVDALGGVEICFDAPIRDAKTGLDIKTAGCQKLSGEYALAFTRSRTPEIYENGRWVPDTTGDFGRIQRQQQFLKSLMRQAISVNAIARWRELSKAVSRGVKVDDGVDVESFIQLYRRFGDMSPDRVEMLSIPGEVKTIGGVSYVVPKQPDANNLFYSLGGNPDSSDVASKRLPRVVQIKVKILDASGKPGLADSVARKLEEQGFSVTDIVDQKPTAGSEIRYERGGEEYARTVESIVGSKPRLVLTKRALDGDIVLLLGTDFQ
jgi:LCP family protein required for cell wall assembly